MANTIDWGQGAVNNTIDWGKGKTNATNNWGAIYDSTAAGETNITGSGGVTPFTNTYSMSFDGVDEYLELNSALVFSGEFSLSVWTKPNTLNINFAQFVGTRTSNTDFIAIYNAQTIQVKLGGITTYIGESVGVNNFVANQWQHILITRDSSNNVTAFRNGVQFGSSVVNSGTTNFEVIARRNTTRYSGYLDELAMWNNDQSSNVSTIYNGGAPTDLTSLSPLSWWRMGDGDTWGGSSWTLTDNGSGGNDATSVNMEEADRVTDVP